VRSECAPVHREWSCSRLERDGLQNACAALDPVALRSLAGSLPNLRIGRDTDADRGARVRT
jgi:hypothetical protein